MMGVRVDGGYDAWRGIARGLLMASVPPEAVLWQDAGQGDLLPNIDGGISNCANGRATAVAVPRSFLTLAEQVGCFRDDGSRWALLYRIVWRLTHGEPKLLHVSVDVDVHRMLMMHKQVRFDAHKMEAFVRFREVEEEGVKRYVAWHRPQHLVVKLVAPFFARRFAAMRWSILTPDISAHWDGEKVTFTERVEAATVADDGLEELWKTYYANIFNPARIKLKAMRREMPARYWPTMPETELIPELLANAPGRVEAMMSKQVNEYPSAEPFLPEKLTLPAMREAVDGCKGCPLYKNATQAVFGEGAKGSMLMFVGEQPGDQEDLAGKPFVGPSGQLLDRVMEKVGIDRSLVYVTNAVKHFKWEPRGKRRLHVKPGAREIAACKPWLQSEIEVVKPAMIVALGATAAQTLMGPAFRITRSRGEVFKDTSWAPWLMATYHPSALLRMPDEEARQQAEHEFEADLKKAAKQLHAAHAM